MESIKQSLVFKIRLKILTVCLQKAGFKNFGSHLVFPDIIPEKPVIIDLGGNKGEFSLEMANRFGGIIHYVEPDPGLFAKFEENEKINKHNLAISDVDSVLPFYLSQNPEGNSFNEKIAAIYGVKEIIEVRTTSFFQFCKSAGIDKTDLLKIDIEGAEIEVLNSLSDDLLRNITQITVEFHEFYDASLKERTYSCIRRLEACGFKKVVFSSESYENTLFINSRISKLKPVTLFWLFIHNLFQHKSRG